MSELGTSSTEVSRSTGSSTGSSTVGGGAGAAPARGIGSVLRYLRQVLDELRKVVRPTRSELLSYTLVVIVFVTLMMLLVSALDFVITRLVLWVFGG